MIASAFVNESTHKIAGFRARHKFKKSKNLKKLAVRSHVVVKNDQVASRGTRIVEAVVDVASLCVVIFCFHSSHVVDRRDFAGNIFAFVAHVKGDKWLLGRRGKNPC